MFGGSGNDTLYGDGLLLDNSTAGNDEFDANTNFGGLYGGAGDDTLYGDGLSLKNSTAGNDTLYGQDGNDTIYGDGLSLINSTPGNDVLWGGPGNDILYGDAPTIAYGFVQVYGADRFIFAPGDKQDTIMDYQQGRDKLDLTSFGVTNLTNLNADINPSGNLTVIDFGGGDVLTLNGSFTLTDSDFYQG
ncbi:hypothetical protein NWP17_03425 [Chrysosporum bergii ANA360D]|uniref:Calcium-binding protein n=2 Tax=Chrysosporum bergii TaxID=105352 RepID=A0AA43GPZ6_9CYAN|nr:hypothetical protein [Chrysosporum bergii ANA360D]